MVKNLPAMQVNWVQSLGQEDPLEKEMATNSSILAWESQGQKSLVGYSPGDLKESDTTEWLSTHSGWVVVSYCILICIHLIMKVVQQILIFFKQLIGKDSDAWRDWGQEEKGTTEDEMAGWHHRLDGCEFQWTLGVGNGQGGLACCNSWGRKESDKTEQLNWTETTFTSSSMKCLFKALSRLAIEFSFVYLLIQRYLVAMKFLGGIYLFFPSKCVLLFCSLDRIFWGMCFFI